MILSSNRLLLNGALSALSMVLVSWLPGAPVAAQDLVINEVLAANHSESFDEDQEGSDWLELTNLSSSAIQLAGYGLSDDPSDPFAWRFPRFELEPGEFWRVWCSGKDRTHSLPTVLTDTRRARGFVPRWIARADEWSSLGLPDDGAPPAMWEDTEFDDRAWERANTEALRDSYRLDARDAQLLLRREFFVPADHHPSNLILETHAMGAASVYLNGVHVLDTVSATEGPDPAAGANPPVGSTIQTARFDLSPYVEVLRPGDNLIALRIAGVSDGFQVELGRVRPVIHTSFRLSKRGGETLCLTAPDGRRVDTVPLPIQTEDRSYGRFPDGSQQFFFNALPTPEQPNSPLHSDRPFPTSLLEVRPSPGRHAAAVKVEITPQVTLDSMEIRYTLDGSAPTSDSALYTQPIALSDDTAVRAALFVGQTSLDDQFVGTYYGWSDISRNLHLPVLAIVLEPEDFRTLQLDTQARGREAEHPATLEVFDEGRQAVRVDFGLRLHGGAGRRGDLRDKKSYRAYFRRSYGTPALRYPLIEDTGSDALDRFILRAGFNDAFRDQARATLIRDQLSRSLYEDMGALVAHGTWCNLLVNGEYRGLYNLVERVDQEFLTRHLPEAGEAWDVVKTRSETVTGSLDKWRELRSLMKYGDVSEPSFYAEARRRMDLENFTSYMILNIWQDNHDWPQNNWYAARPRSPDGRWIFLSWDAEFGLGLMRPGVEARTLQHVLSSNDKLGPTAFRLFLSALLRNDRYRDYFVRELDRHLENVLAPDNVLRHVERLARTLRPDMAEEAARTGHAPREWEANLTLLRETVRKRGPALRHQILSHEDFTFPYVSAVEPRQIVLSGEQELVLRGVRLTPRTQVRFGSMPAVLTRWVSPEEIRAVVPDAAQLGDAPPVTVSDPIGGSQTSRNALFLDHPEPGSFTRGDVDADGRRTLSDVVALLRGLRDPRMTPVCNDALDVDDSGQIELADAAHLLRFLFGTGTRPGTDLSSCGPDRTPDPLSCSSGGCLSLE